MYMNMFLISCWDSLSQVCVTSISGELLLTDIVRTKQANMVSSSKCCSDTDEGKEKSSIQERG